MWTAKELDRHTSSWSAEDVEQLGGLIFQGKQIPQIAKCLGRSQEAVRNKASKLGMLPKRARRKSVSTLSCQGAHL